MDDETLRSAVVRLYAHDYGLRCPVADGGGDAAPDQAALRERCREAIWQRLLSGEVDLRLWISRLARELFLSEAALARGLGLEDAAEFWSWFDRTMWDVAVLRSAGAEAAAAPLTG